MLLNLMLLGLMFQNTAAGLLKGWLGRCSYWRKRFSEKFNSSAAHGEETLYQISMSVKTMWHGFTLSINDGHHRNNSILQIIHYLMCFQA